MTPSQSKLPRRCRSDSGRQKEIRQFPIVAIFAAPCSALFSPIVSRLLLPPLALLCQKDSPPLLASLRTRALAMGKRRRGGINEEILRFVQDNQFVCKQAVSLFDEMPSNWRKVVRPAALLAVFILISQKGVPTAPLKQWMFHFTSGVGLSVFQTRLRDKLISMTHDNPEFYNPRALWILVTAWNASCTNKISGIFKQPATWETPEAIVPQGLQFQQATP